MILTTVVLRGPLDNDSKILITELRSYVSEDRFSNYQDKEYVDISLLKLIGVIRDDFDIPNDIVNMAFEPFVEDILDNRL